MLPSWQIENLTINRLASLADRLISFHHASLLDQQRDSSPTTDTGLAIGLCGDLGVGKTTFTQHLSCSMGVERSEVISPTFVLLRSHRGDRCNLHHLDAYRVHDKDEWWETGIDECLEDPGSVTVVEWADRFPDEMPEETLWLRLRCQVADGLEDECRGAESGVGLVPRVMTVHASTQSLSDWIQAAWALNSQQEVASF